MPQHDHQILDKYQPVAVIGVGRMGSAIAKSWLDKKVLKAQDLILFDPRPSSEAKALEKTGVLLNPEVAVLAGAKTILLAVKPQVWRNAIADYIAHIAPEAVILSILAGVDSLSLKTVFAERPLAQLMPNTALSVGKGVVTVWTEDFKLKSLIEALFMPLAKVVALDGEEKMAVATAISGCGPAYVYALAEAMIAAGIEEGLDPDLVTDITRATVIGAAALIEQSSLPLKALRHDVTSPGGMTEAALNQLTESFGLEFLLKKAIHAAINRAIELKST